MSRIKERLEKAEQGFKLARPEYVTMDKGSVSAVYCKVCGVKIAGLAPVDDFRVQKRSGNQTIIYERLMFQHLPIYREALLEFEDGSKHVTPVCVEHVETLKQSRVLEAVYAADLAQWEREGSNVVAAANENRKPARFVKAANVIEE